MAKVGGVGEGEAHEASASAASSASAKEVALPIPDAGAPRFLIAASFGVIFERGVMGKA